MGWRKKTTESALAFLGRHKALDAALSSILCTVIMVGVVAVVATVVVPMALIVLLLMGKLILPYSVAVFNAIADLVNL